MKKNPLKVIFLFLLIVLTFYILFIKTEKFKSDANIIIKDLSQNQSISTLGSMLLGKTSSTMQDSEILKLYISSEDMFNKLNKEYNLTAYYSSSKIDFAQRLSNNAIIPYFQTTKENLLNCYQKDLYIQYDNLTSTLNISFLNANANRAKAIVKSIIYYSKIILNKYEKENAKVALQSILEQTKENKLLFTRSIKKLIMYQNKHHTIDPKIDVKSKSTILASLESKLIEKRVEYKSKLGYLNKNSAEMRLLLDNIQQMKKSIYNIRGEITGDNKSELNKKVSDFEILKNEVEFNKKRYIQALIKLEETKVSVKQNAKNLIIITKPTLAQTYSEPNKIKDIISLWIILGFLYGIISLIITLIKEHKD